MNRDYTYDIKQVQRFMFDNSIYLLNMFQKKIDSFISTKTKKQRQKQLSMNRHQNNRIDPNTFFDDPTKILSRDLTKPIWNCVVKVDPVVYIDDGGNWAGKSEQMQASEQGSNVSIYRGIYVQMIKHFMHRYKIQHQDQSNLKINLFECQRLREVSHLIRHLNIEQKEVIQTERTSTRELFALMGKCIQKENQILQSLPDLGQVEQNYQYLRGTLQAYNQIIQGYLQDQTGCKAQNRQLDWFLTISMNAMINILDSKSGASLISIQPRIGLINLLIHPMLVSIHNILNIQFKYNQKQKQHKENNQKQKQQPDNNYQHPNQQMHAQQVSPEKQARNKGLSIILQEPVEAQFLRQNSIVYQQLRYTSCSRIAFINLDGYETQSTLDVVKYLSKYLMYVSFPKESFNSKEANELKDFEHYKSERLLRKFFYQALSPEQKKQLLKLHAIQQKDFKRNMFILPIHSRSLSEKYQLLFEQNGSQNHSIQFYESSFIKFMLEEVILCHLREFNPSLIVLSYSGKVTIQNQYFVSLIKQLTVISNFRLLFYTNQSKIFCFEQKGREVVAGEDFFGLEEKYYQNYQKHKINVFHQSNNNCLNSSNSTASNIQNIDLNFLDKISIFLKVSSGTFTLTKTIQQDSYIEKYKNYKIMRYSALLLKSIAKEYPTIQKLRMRANEYLTISKVLKNNYSNKSQTFDKLFEKVVSKHHDLLIKVVEKLIFLQKSVVCSLITSTQGCPFNEQQELIIMSCLPLLLQINQQYEYLSKKQVWEDFKFQYKLELSTEKTQSRFYLHIPRFKQKNLLNATKSIDDLVAAVEFQIIEQKERIPVELTSSSKILYSKQRPFKDALVYLINHIPKQKASNYFSFYGVLNQLIDQKSQAKVQIRPLSIIKQRRMSQFQHYIDFNYFQTIKYVFMFWPKIFDDVQEKLSRMIGEKYMPQSTLDIFRAHRSQPGVFCQLKVLNMQDYQYIIPRNGCTCYQPYEQINRFFIFGGFYNRKQNYLHFQNDVSFIEYSDEANEAKAYNVSKNFYVTTQMCGSSAVVKEFKNDFVRPRIQFQVYEPQRAVQGSSGKEMFLIGGVGQKFMRPYSLISYTGNRIWFSGDGNIGRISRIRTNNLLPVNLSSPIHNRCPQQMNIITNAQNRNIYLNEGIATQQSLVVSRYRYFYDLNQQRFDYEQVYEFADLDKRNYRQETLYLKRAPVEYPLKYELMASAFRGKHFNNNFIKVSSENGKKYIFELQLELSIEVRTIYPNAQKLVRLTGASILAIDINASMLYCLIKHPSFTLDKCILAHFDINELAGKLVDSKAVQVSLKEIHKFDCDVSRSIIVVANSGTVAVLHGYRFGEEVEVPQVILKKYRKNQIKTFVVKPSQQKSVLIPEQELNKHIINQFSCSFFINQNSGVILCLTFKSIQRIKSQTSIEHPIQVVYLRVQKLDMTKDQHRWRMINERIFRFVIGNKLPKMDKLTLDVQQSNEQPTAQGTLGYTGNSQSNGQPGILGLQGKSNYMRLIQIKGNKQSKQKKQKQFLIKVIYNQQIHTSLMNLDNKSQELQFHSVNQSEDQYYKSIYKDNIKQESIYLEKNPFYYQEIKEALQAISSESMNNISLQINQMDLQEAGNN